MLKSYKVLFILASFITGVASAQQAALPSTIKIIVPFAAGASTDAAARVVASELSKRTGSNIIVENLPGASTFIGVVAAAKGAKDGSVLLMTSTSTITAAATKRQVPVDLTKEFLPVAELSVGPLVVASSMQNEIKTPADLVAAARAKPDLITHGTGGVGTLAHVAAEMINDSGNIELKHIPYKGASLAVNDFVAGRIDLMIGVYTTVAPQIQAGRARLVGVTTLEPHPSFPGVPTMASAISGLDINIWVGFFAPQGTPSDVVQRLNSELNEVAKTQAVRDLIGADGSLPQGLSPEEFGETVQRSYATWKKLAVDKNIIVD